MDQCNDACSMFNPLTIVLGTIVFAVVVVAMRKLLINIFTWIAKVNAAIKALGITKAYHISEDPGVFELLMKEYPPFRAEYSLKELSENIERTQGYVRDANHRVGVMDGRIDNLISKKKK